MRRFAFPIILLAGFTLVGTIGFRLTEGWDWLQCLYEAVIIMTTVGLSATNQNDLNDSTKIFVICYLMCGVGVFTYCVSLLAQQVVSLHLRGLLERRKMDRAIKRFKDHYIICGYGRMGSTICQYLHSKNKQFVVIDRDAERIRPDATEYGWPFVQGDATHDQVLLEAGIQRAKALTSVLPTDADNLFVVLSARLLNSHLQIVARASDEKAIDKMMRAGATRVVSPFSSGAIKIARFMLSPNVEDFLEFNDQQGIQLELVDVQISEDSPYIGKRLMDTDLRDKGVMVVGIRRKNGERLMPPSGAVEIALGDCLFVFGAATAVNEMISQSGK
jgi:voltage-gated potassium channel